MQKLAMNGYKWEYKSLKKNVHVSLYHLMQCSYTFCKSFSKIFFFKQ